MTGVRITPGLLLLVTLRTASAQAPAAPKFEYGKRPDAPADWKVQAKGGLLVATGNSQSRNLNLSLAGSRQSGDNKLSLEGGLAYGRSDILVAVLDGNGDIAALARQPQTTTNQWRTRGRYDRFFTSNDSGYLLGQIGADRVAGKRLVGGGQLGYSRQLYKSDTHTAVAELGYDFSYESYFSQPDRKVDPVSIHSARLFLGELAKLTPETGLTASVEALFNLNREHAPDAADPSKNEVDAFKDTRVLAKTGITTTLYKKLSFGFGVTVSYDQNPAPRPAPPGAGMAKYAPGFRPFAARFDTLTEATLVFTFL